MVAIGEDIYMWVTKSLRNHSIDVQFATARSPFRRVAGHELHIIVDCA
jgi:hypothetical protein